MAASLVHIAKQAVTIKYVHIASVVVLVQDTVLGLPDEIEYIWLSKWTFTKFIYLLTRYFAFIHASLMFIYLFDTDLSSKPGICWEIDAIISYMIVIGVVIAGVILGKRTYAAWELSRRVLIYLIIFGMGIVGYMVFDLHILLGHLHYDLSPVPSIAPCISVDHPRKYYVICICLMVADINMLTLTLFKALSHWSKNSCRLVHTLFRDGVFCMLCLVLLSTLNVVVLITEQDSLYYSMMTEYIRPKLQNFGCNLIYSRSIRTGQ